MKLIRCHVENFGKLHDFDYSWTEGINCICRENGWGKSTLMAFIKCMFYGLTGDNKKSVSDSERKKYAPWQGGIFGGKILFESGGKEYEVIRTWGKKASEDTCLIIDADTRLGTKDFDVATSGNTDSLGRQLFGIDEDSFARSAYIAQGEVPGGTTGDINAKISNIADNTDDINNYEKAMETFKDCLNKLSETRQTGKLYAIKSELNRLKGEINLEQVYTEAADKIEAQKKDAENQISQLTQTNENLSRQMEILSRKQDEQIIREKYRMLDSAALDARNELLDAKAAAREVKTTLNSVNPSAGVEIAGIIILVIGVAGVVAGAVMEQKLLLIAGALLAAIGAAVGVIGITRKNKAEKENATRREAYAAAESVADSAQKAYNSALRKRDEFVNSHRELRIQETGGRDTESAAGPTYSTGAELTEAIKRNLEQIDRLRLAIVGYDRQIEEKQEQISGITEKRVRIEELTEMLDSGKEKVRRIELARDLMTQAKTNMTSKYIDPLSERFNHYLGMLAGTTADRFSIDAESNIMADELGAYRDSELMSTGIKDAVGFCLRLALADAMYQGEKPPLVMDDPFVNMDDDNLAGARRVLDEISSEYQVIYFTCHGNS